MKKNIQRAYTSIDTLICKLFSSCINLGSLSYNWDLNFIHLDIISWVSLLKPCIVPCQRTLLDSQWLLTSLLPLNISTSRRFVYTAIVAGWSRFWMTDWLGFYCFSQWWLKIHLLFCYFTDHLEMLSTSPTASIQSVK